jgi:hypothetical protein
MIIDQFVCFVCFDLIVFFVSGRSLNTKII